MEIYISELPVHIDVINKEMEKQISLSPQALDELSAVWIQKIQQQILARWSKEQSENQQRIVLMLLL